MGGDRAPTVAVEGALEAIAQGHGPIILVGDEALIEAELSRARAPRDQIEVVHAAEAIGMAEHPGRAARAKQQSSMHVGFRLVKDKRALGFVSAGNTGAMMAVGLLTLRRLPFCDRPAIASAIPTMGPRVVLLDMGANVECRASHLVQFALMGAAYAEIELGRARPSVGLLSNGVEPNKGTETLREAHRLLNMTDLRYIGYIEGQNLPSGEVDVIVTDGFVGNIALKLSEGITLALVERLRQTLKGDWLGAMGAFLMKRALSSLRRDLDWTQIGGAPLLGLNGLSVVAHGGSTPQAIANALALARRHDALNLVERLKAILEASSPPDEMTSTAELPITRTSNF
ncbi:phosphate acyltransferase PlsX [Myxococcota bacterium]|nr:phosphate acyltransferase PlsX [Myxococcota bacterium]